jgi:hypothetical protein
MFHIIFIFFSLSASGKRKLLRKKHSNSSHFSSFNKDSSLKLRFGDTEWNLKLETRERTSERDERASDLSQVGVVVVLLLDSQQHRGVPLIQARDAVVVFDRVGESVDVLFLQVFNECLSEEKFVRILGNSWDSQH